MPRTLTIVYPDGRREYWFTDQVFEAGDLLERGAASWFVVSVSEFEGPPRTGGQWSGARHDRCRQPQKADAIDRAAS